MNVEGTIDERLSEVKIAGDSNLSRRKRRRKQRERGGKENSAVRGHSVKLSFTAHFLEMSERGHVMKLFLS